MKRWFERRPIHQKLVVLALVVTTAALTLAIGGLVAIDLWSYRQGVVTNTGALASVIAETASSPRRNRASPLCASVRRLRGRACICRTARCSPRSPGRAVRAVLQLCQNLSNGAS
jgi:hypothetical protein